MMTTLLTCLLAYALLFPKGLLPQGYEIAVVQSRFFEVSWGGWGRILFLVVAAAFLSDTWLATVDAVSRTHADCVYGFFPRSHRISYRKWYLIFLLLLTLVTGITVQMNEPSTLILISAVIGFVGHRPLFRRPRFVESHLPATPSAQRSETRKIKFLSLASFVHGLLGPRHALCIVSH
jgi:hypothetical protein